MLTHLLKIASLTIAITVTNIASAYDANLAQSYSSLFASVKGAQAGKAMHLMDPDAFVNKVIEKEPLVVLDVRTPAETAIYGATLPGTLVIPLNELFTEANLARIPSPALSVPFPSAPIRPAAAAWLALLPGASWTGPCREDGMVDGGGRQAGLIAG